MKTNHLMLIELLEKYHPETRGVVTAREMDLISKTLCFKDMDILQLRNLRDYVVLAMTKEYDGLSFNVKDWDRMSAITYTIDCKIISLGGEV